MVDKSIAKALVAQALLLGGPVNQMLDLTDGIADEKTKKEYREMIGYVMAYATDIILSVEKLYPELNPDLD